MDALKSWWIIATNYFKVNKNVKADIAVLGDVKHTIKEIFPLIEAKNHDKWIDEFHNYYKIEYEKVIDNEYNKKKGGLSMARKKRFW